MFFLSMHDPKTIVVIGKIYHVKLISSFQMVFQNVNLTRFLPEFARQKISYQKTLQKVESYLDRLIALLISYPKTFQRIYIVSGKIYYTRKQKNSSVPRFVRILPWGDQAIFCFLVWHLFSGTLYKHKNFALKNPLTC
jgi:hypothetical protein